MPTRQIEDDIVRFGVFEFSMRTGELRRNGLRLKLQEQPSRILRLLLEKPGELVSREQIQKQLWPNGVFVDYENAINSAVRKLREALLDTSENPRFIETLPRRGYRFIASVVHPAPTQQEVPSATVMAPATPPRANSARKTQKWVFAFALVGCVLVLAATFWSQTRSSSEALIPAPLTTYPGTESHASFSPDGNQVAFSWTADAAPHSGIYVKSVAAGTSLRLTSGASFDVSPAWSPDGQWIAFARGAKTAGPIWRCTFFKIPPVGGAERELAQVSSDQCLIGGWSPDGRWLVVSAQNPVGSPNKICLISTENGEIRWLTAPPRAGTHGDEFGIISPDGKTIAFSRFLDGTSPREDFDSDIYTLALTSDYTSKGLPRRLTEDHATIGGIAWTRDSRDIVFSSAKGGVAALWRISASGGRTTPLPLTDGAAYPAISPQGNRLVYEKAIPFDTNIWQVNLSAPGARAIPFISSTRAERNAQYSPDGTKVVFQSLRSGNSEIWICDADGSKPIQLTTLGRSGSPRWSPDGRTIAFDGIADQVWQVFTIPAQGGSPRQITTDAGGLRPAWSHDGKWLWFARRPHLGIWKVPTTGGRAVRIVDDGSDPVESKDGSTVWYSRLGSIWKMDPNGRGNTRVIDDCALLFQDLQPSSFALGANGIWYAKRNPKLSIWFYSFVTASSSLVYNVPKEISLGMSVSPDQRWLLYSQYDTEAGSDLMIVNNYH